MNELSIRPTQLPDTLPELAKYILFTQEKLVSVRSEIRALKKLELASEIIEQKTQEARMVSEALLDAQRLIGNETKKIPKASGGDHGNQHTGSKNGTAASFGKSCSAATFGKIRTAANFAKPKSAVIRDLGFSKDQVSRMEVLADNPDLVEEVKERARESGDIPTQQQVLNLAKYRKQKVNETIHGTKIADKFLTTLRSVLKLDTSSSALDTIVNVADATSISAYLSVLDSVQNKLDAVRHGLLERTGGYDVKKK